MITVDLCVATFKRPALLGQLLESIARMSPVDNVSVRLIIIDNDVEQTGFPAVQQFQREYSVPVLYEVEPQRGISFARNRAISLVTGEFFGFLDDDEWVCEGWLRSAFETITIYDFDAVFGPVISRLPPEAPAWATKHPSFLRPRHETGKRVSIGATGNVLLRTRALGHPRILFCNDYALTGGGDTEFFSRMCSNGKSLGWCDEAEVYEEVPLQRLRLRWVFSRAYRSGQCYCRIFILGTNFRVRAFRFSKKMMQFGGGLILSLVVFFCSRSLSVRVMSKVFEASGELSVLLGFRKYYAEYAAESYRQQRSNMSLKESQIEWKKDRTE